MKTETVIKIHEALKHLVEIDSDPATRLQLTGKKRMHIARAAREAHAIFADYEHGRNGLIRQLGEAVDNGTRIQIPMGDKMDEFNREVDGMLFEETTEIKVPTLSEAELEANPAITLKVIALLDAIGAIEWSAVTA